MRSDAQGLGITLTSPLQLWLSKVQACLQTSIDVESHEAPPLAEQLTAAGGWGVTSILLGGVWLLLAWPCLVTDPNPWVLDSVGHKKEDKRRKGHWGVDPKGTG